jgi:hypothetical protein
MELAKAAPYNRQDRAFSFLAIQPIHSPARKRTKKELFTHYTPGNGEGNWGNRSRYC